MFLNRIHLDPRCREARRDLADPYQLHATLCRAFSKAEEKCPAGAFLWRLEPETGIKGLPTILVQSRSAPMWASIEVTGWLAQADPPIDLKKRLNAELFKAGRHCRFRLRANPCVCRNGKRLGLLSLEEQERWIERKSLQHGFSLPKLPAFDLSESSPQRLDVCVSQERILRGRQHSGNAIQIFSVLYDGILQVTDPAKFIHALQTGIGHGKTMGLGLLSAVPIV
jgi:CRISPR system Cascade subunit CasE